VKLHALTDMASSRFAALAARNPAPNAISDNNNRHYHSSPALRPGRSGAWVNRHHSTLALALTLALKLMFPPHIIPVILSKFLNLPAELVLDHGTICAEADAKWIHGAVATQTVPALHVPLEREL